MGHSMGLPWRHFGRTRLVYSGMHSRARARSYMYVYICIYIYIYICIYMYIYRHISIYSTGEPRGFSQGTRMNERYSLNGYSKGTRKGHSKGTRRSGEGASGSGGHTRRTQQALHGTAGPTGVYSWCGAAYIHRTHGVLTGHRSMELGAAPPAVVGSARFGCGRVTQYRT